MLQKSYFSDICVLFSEVVGLVDVNQRLVLFWYQLEFSSLTLLTKYGHRYRRALSTYSFLDADCIFNRSLNDFIDCSNFYHADLFEWKRTNLEHWCFEAGSVAA